MSWLAGLILSLGDGAGWFRCGPMPGGVSPTETLRDLRGSRCLSARAFSRYRTGSGEMPACILPKCVTVRLIPDHALAEIHQDPLKSLRTPLWEIPLPASARSEIARHLFAHTGRHSAAGFSRRRPTSGPGAGPGQPRVSHGDRFPDSSYNAGYNSRLTVRMTIL